MTTPLRTSALSAAAIADAVFTLEDRLDLSASVWQQDDVHWWPLYRTELYRLLFTAAAGSTGVAARADLRPAWQAVHTEAPPTAPHAVWLVSDGISYSCIGSRDIERFCSPLWAHCRSLGVPAVVVDRGRARAPATTEPLRWVAPWAVRAKIGGLLTSKVSAGQRHCELVAAVRRAAQSTGVALPAVSARRMHALAGAVLRLARRIEPCLRREQVRALFIVGFYDVSGYAFTLAAARAGVPSVDIQHGVTGRYHLGYASWPRRRQPWRLLPRWFWTWTETDAALIAQWADESAHAAVCGGHPFLDAWDEGHLRLDSAQQARLDGLVADSAGSLPVLVTLQPNLVHPAALQPLLDAMHQCREATWWLRLHPMSLGERAALEALLAVRGVGRWEIDRSTQLPLPALLARAGAHATHSSSTFIEAAAMGVPSIVWSPYGVELAEDDVRAGSTHAALDGTAFAQRLNVLAQSPSRPRAAAAKAGSAALRRILETAA